MPIALYFIKEQYFLDHSNYIKMLDPYNHIKQSKRAYLCLKIDIGNNEFYIPLRNNLGPDLRKFGRIGHSVPSKSRPNAGLDYRYALIINDQNYVDTLANNKISTSQVKKINQDIINIENEFKIYVQGFIKVAKKSRINKEPLYRESCLVNFIEDLNI